MKLLETIRFENGVFSNLLFHQNRMNESRKKLFNCSDEIDLALSLYKNSSSIEDNQLYKCRIIYDVEINNIEYIPYYPPSVKSLQLVVCDEIEYSHKYLDRKQINELLSKKGVADDIIIVKHGRITDSSIFNLLFYNGKQWITPAFPLLKGTQRTSLLYQEKIKVADIIPSNLHNFSKIRLINAMLRFEDEVDINIEDIYL